MPTDRSGGFARATRRSPWRRSEWGPALLAACLLVPVLVPAVLGQRAERFPGAARARAFPDSTGRILVFNDQLDTGAMSDAMWRFAATHYVGTQKLGRSDTRRLRAINPAFIVLHYRLGQALGHSMPTPDCQPDGRTWLRFVHGDEWVVEWPGDRRVAEAWFYRVGGQAVYNCVYGHLLANLDDPGWRDWWSQEVITQLIANESDGIFADTYSVPNYLGPVWKPALPAIDDALEQRWADRLHAFTDFMRARLAGRWLWIPNVGALVTTRDPTDYANADGVMVEGFAIPATGERYPVDDWVLQQNRVLSLGRDRIVILQAYPDGADVAERAFVLASYLLVKGSRTYVNLDTGLALEWFPEYGIDLGTPLRNASRVSDLWDASSGLYTRAYERGLVLVNPDRVGRRLTLDRPMMRVVATGGGPVPASGRPPGTLSRRRVTEVLLGPREAAILTTVEPRSTEPG